MCGKNPYATPATTPAHADPVTRRTNRNVTRAVSVNPTTPRSEWLATAPMVSVPSQNHSVLRGETESSPRRVGMPTGPPIERIVSLANGMTPASAMAFHLTTLVDTSPPTGPISVDVGCSAHGQVTA